MMMLLRVVLFTLIIPCTVTVWVPLFFIPANYPMAFVDIGHWRYLGLPMIAVGIAIYAWCTLDFARRGQGTPAPYDPPRKLVAQGLYRHVRNPMYLGVLLLVAGEAVWFHSRTLLWYWVGSIACFQVFVFGYEEPTLRRLFGESYKQYCQDVPRWIPRLR